MILSVSTGRTSINPGRVLDFGTFGLFGQWCLRNFQMEGHIDEYKFYVQKKRGFKHHPSFTRFPRQRRLVVRMERHLGAVSQTQIVVYQKPDNLPCFCAIQ